MVRTSKKIDPIAVAAYAMKHVLTKADYSRIVAANKPTDIETAWQTLSPEDQQRISGICNDAPPPELNALAIELAACGTKIQLQALKTEYGENATRSAWKLIPMDERRRLKALCDNRHQQQSVEEHLPVTEQPQLQDTSEIPVTYPENVAKVNAWLQKEGLTEPQQPQQLSQQLPKTRSLFSISDDLEKLNELLDDCGDDTQQQQLINDWLEQLGDERDRKLDNYSALIVEMTSKAAARKAEAQRLMGLAASDENRAKLLKDRLKCFFQMHNIRTLDTARYRLSLAKNGGKAPLILDASVPATQLPEQFQKVSIDPNTTAIREALERGEKLDFAQLGERGTSIRIK